MAIFSVHTEYNITHSLMSELSWAADNIHFHKEPIISGKSINDHAVACFIYNLKKKTRFFYYNIQMDGRAFHKKIKIFFVCECVNNSLNIGPADQ